MILPILAGQSVQTHDGSSIHHRNISKAWGNWTAARDGLVTRTISFTKYWLSDYDHFHLQMNFIFFLSFFFSCATLYYYNYLA